MKLYTEEQVRQMLEVCILSDKYPDVLTLNDVLKTQTPIQLPSDEEIDKEAFQVPYDNTRGFYDLQFIKGAKWMRDKIQGGNK
jgi:hypothetical protein